MMFEKLGLQCDSEV